MSGGESGKDYHLYLPDELPQGWNATHSMTPTIGEAGTPTKRFDLDISGSGRITDSPDGISISSLPGSENNRVDISLDTLLPPNIRSKGRFRIQMSWTEDPASPERGSFPDILEEVLTPLDAQEQQVIRMRFGLDNGIRATQGVIGKEIGRSPRTVGRIEKRALTKLREEEGMSVVQLRELFLDVSDEASLIAQN